MRHVVHTTRCDLTDRNKTGIYSNKEETMSVCLRYSALFHSVLFHFLLKHCAKVCEQTYTGTEALKGGKKYISCEVLFD